MWKKAVDEYMNSARQLRHESERVVVDVKSVCVSTDLPNDLWKACTYLPEVITI
jgi:hypothetical protein